MVANAEMEYKFIQERITIKKIRKLRLAEC